MFSAATARTAVSISRFPDLSGRAPERRFHHRVLAGATGWLLVDGQRFDAECVNVSMGGASVLCSAAVHTGDIVRLELPAGMSRGSASIRCEVVRASQTDVGLRFLALDRPSLDAIVSLL
jgi:hypothetical protein